MEPGEVVDEIKRHSYKRVCITGGEPLLQKELSLLLDLLWDYRVTIETNGSIPINTLTLGQNHSFALDMKCPSSGFSGKMEFNNFEYLTGKDEIKFIVGSREDYEWAKSIIREHYKNGTITFSPVFGKIKYEDVVEWILHDKLDARFQLQLHKLIWSPERRGV
jgi:7-carboxy-7-deazaguanine synthase